MKHINPIKHTTAENYEHFLSYMYGSGARHSAILCQAYFDGADAPHEEYEAYMVEHPEQPVNQEPVALVFVNRHGDVEITDYTLWQLERGHYKIYAAPVRTKDLTVDEKVALADRLNLNGRIVVIDAVIAADREKNHG